MTQEGRRACDWKSTSKQVGGKIGKSVFPKAEMRWGATGNSREGAGTKLSRKASSEESGITLRSASTTYDAAGRVAFQSYPSSDIVPAAFGVWTIYDDLSRVKEVRQDSEHGQLTTRTEYLGLQRRVIGPSGEQTLTTYQAFDQPSYELPIKVEEPLGKTTRIPRDVFGKPTEIERSQ